MSVVGLKPWHEEFYRCYCKLHRNERIKAMKAEVKVFYREEILDPQGLAIAGTLRSMGFNSVKTVRIGKLIQLELNCDDEAEAKEQVTTMCEKLLANPVIENYKIELE